MGKASGDRDRIPFSETELGMFVLWRWVPVGGFRSSDVLQVSEILGSNPTDAAPPWLVATVPLNADAPQRRVPLVKYRMLHRQFAKLQGPTAKILQFANRYGLLGKGLALHDPALSKQVVQHGESFGYWYESIDTLGRLIALWDLVVNEDRDELRKYVSWKSDGKGRPTVHMHVASADGRLRPDIVKGIASKKIRGPEALRTAMGDCQHFNAPKELVAGEGLGRPEYDALIARWQYGDSVAPARQYVHQVINQALAGRVSPKIVPERPGRLHFVPHTLLAALYVLLMIEVSSGTNAPGKMCRRPGCTEYFQPADTRQIYCCRRCTRLASYYRKRDERRSEAHGKARQR